MCLSLHSLMSNKDHMVDPSVHGDRISMDIILLIKIHVLTYALGKDANIRYFNTSIITGVHVYLFFLKKVDYILFGGPPMAWRSS